MNTTPDAYRVLARKYRPASFDTLIGQDAMVRTLGNAIAAGRIAHAFLLTGVRGVGKTSTARLIARALNCIGLDGNGGPTMSPCGQCDNCRSIGESRHIDVMEMDAASRTGVDDIREIIDSVQYAPVSARYKIYIIDEVHMLSKNAFNALLKTLEEPPPHVKFIFATTELRKLPVTVLSRCQRFDLRRITADLLVSHFANICKAESVAIDEASLAMIARAAEGSVRDGLSLLDQAIAHGGGVVEGAAVRDMLGLADRGQVLDLMKAILLADAPQTLASIRNQYDLGADPATILSDLLELVHGITRVRVAEATIDASADEALLISQWATQLSMPALQRLWQMLSRGLAEVQQAPSAIEAAEMVLLRLIYAADLPDPADLLRKLANGEVTSARPAKAEGDSQGSGSSAMARIGGTPSGKNPPPADFDALIALFERNNEGIIGKNLRDDCVLIALTANRLELSVLPGAPRDLLARLRHCLDVWTGISWQVVHVEHAQGETVRMREAREAKALDAKVRAHPLVQAVQQRFPDARLVAIESLGERDAQTAEGQG
jgi:DNA polymerase III subunit gamma/tau